jgi:hypothetical protein
MMKCVPAKTPGRHVMYTAGETTSAFGLREKTALELSPTERVTDRQRLHQSRPDQDNITMAAIFVSKLGPDYTEYFACKLGKSGNN